MNTSFSSSTSSKTQNTITSERILQFIKRVAHYRSNSYVVDREIIQLALDYILDIFSLDIGPLLSTPITPVDYVFGQHQRSTSMEASSSIRIESERYDDSHKLISKKIYMCVYLQEFSLALFRNNIPK